VAVFCLGRGIKKDAYYYWQRVLKKRRPEIFDSAGQKGDIPEILKRDVLGRGKKTSGRPSFARVNVLPPSGETKKILEIILPNQVKLNCSENIDVACLEKILSVLEARLC